MEFLLCFFNRTNAIIPLLLYSGWVRAFYSDCRTASRAAIIIITLCNQTAILVLALSLWTRKKRTHQKVYFFNCKIRQTSAVGGHQGGRPPSRRIRFMSSAHSRDLFHSFTFVKGRSVSRNGNCLFQQHFHVVTITRNVTVTSAPGMCIEIQTFLSWASFVSFTCICIRS